MAGPCEVIVDDPDKTVAEKATTIAQAEAIRIEHKFSRYRSNNIVFNINQANGQGTQVDEETARLLDYAQQCYLISNGLFDISAGVLREVWHFNGGDQVPTQAQVKQTLQKVGWDKLNWQNPTLTLQPGMEIDFGGIGKEYAVDRTAILLGAQIEHNHLLINYGGDLCAMGPRANGDAWEIGLQNPHGKANSALAKVTLFNGAVTTSGDLHKFIKKDGIRYGHILNPTTGWPSKNAPRQVTVIGATCLEAGILSTLAILQGDAAESFLADQDVEHRVIR